MDRTLPNRRSRAALRLAALGAASLALLPQTWAKKPPVDRAAEADAKAREERLAVILRRFDETQAATRTLTATFVERKEIALLREPIVSRGKFFYTKPDDVLWEYSEPDPHYFLINKDELLSYFPRRHRAERVSIGPFHDRLMKVFAIGQPAGVLRKYYDIALDEAGNDLPDTQLLVLHPRKRSVRKRIEEVRIWVGGRRALPVRMQYREPDGDCTTIQFEDLRFNPEIAARTYRIDIPPDVPVRKGFSGLQAGDGEG